MGLYVRDALNSFKPALIFAALCVLQIAAFSFASVYDGLRYIRVDFLDGEFWRVLTGQLVHINLPHALVNMSAGAMLYFLSLQLRIVRQFWQSTLFSLFGVAFALVFFLPNVSWYVGMSGFLHGVALVVILNFAQQYPLLGGVVLFGFAAKLIYEFYNGATSDMGFAVVTEAHLAGAVSGMIFLLAHKIYRLNK